MAVTATCTNADCAEVDVVKPMNVKLRTPDEPVFCGACGTQVTLDGEPDEPAP